MMNDKQLRHAVKTKVLERYAGDPETRILDELGLRHGAARIDIAVVNGILHGFELKSDMDSLKRLPHQVQIYSSVLDKVTLVVGRRHEHDVNGQDTLIFKPDRNGQMQMIISFPFMIFQRVGLWQNNRILLPVLGASLLIMLLTLVLWPVAWFVRRHYGHKLELTPMERRLRLAVRLVFALDLFFIAALTGLVVYATTNIDFLSDRGNTWVHLVQVIGVLGAIGALLVLFNAIRTWTNKRNRIWGKLQATIFVLACLGFLWFAFAGNLLHFSSNY